jgi:predicted RNase H-like HicB family nuclease
LTATAARAQALRPYDREKDEAGYYVAEVPALPGCLSQGETYDEALSNIKEAIEGWF